MLVIVYFIDNDRMMIEIKQTQTYLKWQSKLRDMRAKALIAARIFRLANGLPGDVKLVVSWLEKVSVSYAFIMGLGIVFTLSSVVTR